MRSIMMDAMEGHLQQIEAEVARLRTMQLQTTNDHLVALKASRELARAASSLNLGLKNLVLHRGSRNRKRLHQTGTLSPPTA